MAIDYGKLERKVYRIHYICPILKMEKKAFGWHFEGKEYVKSFDGYDGKIDDEGKEFSLKPKFSITQYALFARPKYYPSNIMFGLVEVLSNLVSFFRRLAFGLLWLVFIAAMFYFNMPSTNPNGTEGNAISLILSAIYVGLPILSVILALIGKLMNNAFKLDKKCDKLLEEHGYEVWSTEE